MDEQSHDYQLSTDGRIHGLMHDLAHAVVHGLFFAGWSLEGVEHALGH